MSLIFFNDHHTVHHKISDASFSSGNLWILELRDLVLNFHKVGELAANTYGFVGIGYNSVSYTHNAKQLSLKEQ